jgi:prepilin-type N-terminal cleavage/methylation domain-containing protein/prepilin-type processing-associated H-X9-DG protein
LPRQRPRAGFTLIELLVVISIIAILASMLLPSLTQAQENTKGASCANNMKQQGLALAMYIDEYDEFYPYCYNAADANNPPRVAPPQHLLKYAGAQEVFYCPGDRSTTTYSWWGLTIHPDFTRGGSYMYSESALGVGSLGPIKTGKVKHPASYGFGSEGNMVVNMNWSTLDYPFSRAKTSHVRGVNVLFGDLHVEKRPMVGMRSLSSNPLQ